MHEPKYLLGLIGYPLAHSFSKRHFTALFEQAARTDIKYEFFPLREIGEFPALLRAHPNLVGLNVTIPHKRAIIPYLNQLDPIARRAGAVNTLVIRGDQRTGYNTDVTAFRESLATLLRRHNRPPENEKAIILGTGGAAQAVRVALEDIGIGYRFVSRRGDKAHLTYPAFKALPPDAYTLIINATPLGTFPNTDTCPDIAYEKLTPAHIAYDLVYNPPDTLFLRKAKKAGCILKNGAEMLALQAESALRIWELNIPIMPRILPLKTNEKITTRHAVPRVDFDNTELAFAYKSDAELKATDRVFRLMSKPTLVRLGSKIAPAALRWHLPFIKPFIRKTIYQQFCGGTTLLNSLPVIQKLAQYRVMTILDYSSEGNDEPAELNKTMNEIVRAIEFAKDYPSVPIVSVKLSGLAPNILLTKLLDEKKTLSKKDLSEYREFLKRVDNICHVAQSREVTVFFDAEESWLQDAIDHVVMIMMRRYNKSKAVVFNTYQMYRKDRLAVLMRDHETAEKDGFILGVKTVRGAYMDQERERARRLGLPDPIHPTKEATDKSYNLAIKFCLDHIDRIALCNATHNEASCRLHIEYLQKKNIPPDHPNQMFAQLYGMSDHLTFNLAHAGYPAAKYLPYGPIEEVIPYLIRRAEENTSITGEVTRERSYVLRELKRRGIKTV